MPKDVSANDKAGPVENSSLKQRKRGKSPNNRAQMKKLLLKKLHPNSVRQLRRQQK